MSFRGLIKILSGFQNKNCTLAPIELFIIYTQNKYIILNSYFTSILLLLFVPNILVRVTYVFHISWCITTYRTKQHRCLNIDRKIILIDIIRGNKDRFNNFVSRIYCALCSCKQRGKTIVLCSQIVNSVTKNSKRSRSRCSTMDRFMVFFYLFIIFGDIIQPFVVVQKVGTKTRTLYERYFVCVFKNLTRGGVL